MMRAAQVALAMTTLLVAGMAAPAISLAAQPGGPPDLVVVMVDDLGAIDQRVLERLPNIRELFIDGGRRFDAAYSETPLCCPARAAFLTGQHTWRHGVVINDARLLDPSQTLFTALDSAGYNTAVVGKYLNRARLMPDWTPPGYDHVAMMLRQPTMTTSSWAVNGTTVEAGVQDRFALDESVRWLETAAAGESPLALWASFFAPHAAPKQAATPWVTLVEPQYEADPRCAGIVPWQPPSYNYAAAPDGFPLTDVCESLLTVDEFVGEARRVLGERDAVWVLMSDNGMAYGANGFPTKSNPFSVRFPMYFSGRGVSTGVVGALVSNIDVGPTLAELAGTAMPWADGISFAGLLSGGDTARTWIYEDFPVAVNTNGPWSDEWWGVRTKRWHMYKRPDKLPRLFDLAADPWELQDVRADYPSVVRRLRGLAATVRE